MTLTFPHQLDRVRDSVLAQQDTLEAVARNSADALASGGLIHVYANGRSRIAVEEMIVRMGALTGFHPLLAPGLATFDGVVGTRGIRVNQRMERVEGLSASILDEYDIGAQDVFLVLSATGTTQAAVDMALEVQRKEPVAGGGGGTSAVCPLSSIGALTVAQSLNERTIRELDQRGQSHHVLRDQRARSARALYCPQRHTVEPE